MAADDPAPPLTPERIRALRAEDTRSRARDFAARHGLAEAALVAAHAGHGATRIAAHPDALMPHLRAMGDVMALTRNDSCVIERRGVYADCPGDDHARRVSGDEIDLRLVVRHWVHAFAVHEGDARSVQVFDAAGDAVHKIHLKPESDAAAFDRMVAALRADDASDTIALSPRGPEDPARADALRADWADPPPFASMIAHARMTPAAARRPSGEPLARALAPAAVPRLLDAVARQGVPVMIRVGNKGCIQTHDGPIRTITPMGPWINVMDPRFNLHLRGDHVAEVRAVDQPARPGALCGLAALDRRGMPILEIFRSRRHGRTADFDAILAGLPPAADPA